MKIFSEYIANYKGYAIGDTTQIEEEEFIELEKKGIVRAKTELCTEVKKELSDKMFDDFLYQNIKGQKYKRNKVDIVILTKDKNAVKPIFEEESRLNSFEIIESDFIKTGKGFAENCNIGAGIYKKLGEFILFLNDDVEIPNKEQFLIDLIAPFKDQKVGMVGCKASEVSFGINGSIMCVRRELFEMIGGFDTNYFFMWEDNDMNKQITKRGYKVVISQANASHNGKESMNTQSEFWREYFYLGQAYFERKWADKNRIIGSMIIGNENDRYLEEVITNLFKRHLIDYLVVVCDDSNEETKKELQTLQKYLPITIHYHDFKLFGTAENILRERSIQYAMSFNPYGIIPIDADEILDEELNRAKLLYLLTLNVGTDFAIAHFWNDRFHIRTDGIFSQQKNCRLFRVLWNESSKFYNKGLHCGSAPIYAYAERKMSEYYFRHYGYLRKEDVKAKHIRQVEHDPKKVLENPYLYDNMLDESVAVIEKFNKINLMKVWKK